MKIGIMGAMPEEVSGIIAALSEPKSQSLGGRDYWEGDWHGVPVVVVFSRWGKVASAATAAILVALFGVEEILFIGVAGATDPSLRLGDVVVADALLQHDMDASAIPAFERFEIPLLGKISFGAGEAARDRAVQAVSRYLAEDFENGVTVQLRRTFGIDRPTVRHGLIASGDRFVTDRAYIANLLKALPDLLCVEMEGAAVAQVCFEMQIPVTVIRIVSDQADEHAPIDFPRFASEVASTMTCGIAECFVQDRHL